MFMTWHSFHLSCLCWCQQDFHELLTVTHGLPVWASYALFGICTVLAGLLIGMVNCLIIAHNSLSYIFWVVKTKHFLVCTLIMTTDTLLQTYVFDRRLCGWSVRLVNFIIWRPRVRDHLTDYFVLGSPECKSSAILVNSPLACHSLVRIHNSVKCDVNCFRHLLGPTSISSINTAEGK